jgi:hypothetical protein
MDSKEIKTLCLKHVYGTALTEAERRLVDEYTETDVGRDYLKECLEMKIIMNSLADVDIKPVDHDAMVERFECAVRESFDKTVFRPWWRSNFAFVVLGLMAGVFIVLDDGWSVINILLLGSCVLWLITDCVQRCYYAKILSRPDLYEYAKASRRRSDRMLQSLTSRTMVVLTVGMAIAVIMATAYGTWLGYLQYGIIVPAILLFVLVDIVAIVGIVIYQYRKLKRSDAEVWDWWSEDLKE